jgi:hypothetical protein
MTTLIVAILFQVCLTPAFANLTTPNLTAPVIGSLYNEPNALLDWSGVTGATDYEYRLSTNSNLVGASIITVNGSSQENASNLLFGTVYYWQVRAIKTSSPADSSSWSAIWSFKTIDNLFHLAPANNSISINNPLIDWTGISGITGYQYRYSTNFNFSNSSLLTNGTTSQANLSNLSYGTQYFWQVRAFHAVDTSEWSLPWSFTTVYQLANPPSLISPAT